MFKFVGPLFFICLLSTSTFAQVDSSGTETQQTDSDQNTQLLIENLVEDSESENFDFGTQFENLEDFQANPLDLNNASQEALTEFGLLSAIQIQALLNYRRLYGQIYSLYELQGVPTWDLATIQKVLPYVSISEAKEKEKMNFKRMFKYGRHQIFARYQRILEEQKGFTEAEDSTTQRYLGSPNKFYARYRMSYKDRMSLGVTMENDAGEEFFTGSNKQGFDFYSAHFYLKDLHKNVHSVALGDFQVFFGQGLTIWGGFGTRKGADVLNIKRMSLPIRPYTSVNEATFMRGGAAVFNFMKKKQLEVTVFGSLRQRDANIADIPDDLDGLDSLDQELDASNISSLQAMGFHRTSNEIDNENTITMLTTGARLKYTGANWHISGNAVYNRLSKELVKDTPSPYEQFYFRGQSLFNASLDYSYNYKNLQFFGETAVSDNAGVATLNGLLADLDEKVSMSIFHRHYSRDYQTLLGNALGEGSGVRNENGLYMGLQARLGGGFKFSAYADVFEFPWLRYLVDAPSRGYEFLGRLDYSPSYYSNFYAQYRYEKKGRNLTDNLGKFDELTAMTRQSLRLHMSYKVSSQFALRSRVEFAWHQAPTMEKGVVVYQDLVYTPKAFPFKAQVRLAYFDTESYNTRIYAYENDVLYSFSVPAYSGQGLRYYLNTSYRINRNISLWLRFAQTYYTDRTVISSGLNEIEGRTRSDVKFQIRVKF